MRVNTHFLTLALHRLRVLAHEMIDLFAVQIAVTIHHHHRADRRLRGQLQHRVDFRVLRDGNGHQIQRRLIAQLVAMVDHFHRLGNLVRVTRHADHRQHALLGRDDLPFPVALPPRIRHRRQLQPRRLLLMIAHHPPHVLLLARFQSQR